MKRLIVFGIGKIADVVYHHLVRDHAYQVVAFTCDADWLNLRTDPRGMHLGCPVLPFENIERHFPPESVAMFIAIGYHELNTVRERKCREAQAKGYTLISYISPRADHGPWLDVGINCLILDGVGIQPGVKIGNNVFLWNNVLIGHHSTVGDHCWVAAGATLGGLVDLGERSFVGLNATITGELVVGPDCFLGAGTLIVKSALPRSVFIAPSTSKFRLESDVFLRMTKMPSIGTSKN